MTQYDDRLAGAIARMPAGSRNLGGELCREMLDRGHEGPSDDFEGSALEREIVERHRANGLADAEIDRRFGWDQGRAARIA